MAFFGTDVEYALHTLVWLAKQPNEHLSSRDLADLQKIPSAFLAKILAKLEKARLVVAADGIRGGYKLGKDAREITILQSIDALDCGRRLFDCRDIRKKCALWGNDGAPFPIGPVCGIHAAMLAAESAMRTELANTTIEQLARGAYRKAPSGFQTDVRNWLLQRHDARDARRAAAVRASARRKTARSIQGK